MITNQTAEQIVCAEIHKMLLASDWQIQSKKQNNLAACNGISIRKYQTDIGPADYIHFVRQKSLGVIETKSEEGVRLTVLKISMLIMRLQSLSTSIMNDCLLFKSRLKPGN